MSRDSVVERRGGFLETAQAVLNGLYTSFILRDFAGKVVPGAFFAFSVLSLFYKPKDIIAYVSQVPVVALAIWLGFSWTYTLGVQSLAEYIGIWNYFPHDTTGTNALHQTPRAKFILDQLRIVDFLRIACPDEKNQYERFVVIKEACGNLFLSISMSIPFWTVIFVRSIASSGFRCIYVVYTLLVVTFTFGGLFGLYRMNGQHVERQYDYADAVAKKYKSRPCEKDTESAKK
jgi:hypothetical protein